MELQAVMEKRRSIRNYNPDSENVVSVIAVGYRGQEPPERPKRKEIEVVAKFI